MAGVKIIQAKVDNPLLDEKFVKHFLAQILNYCEHIALLFKRMSEGTWISIYYSNNMEHCLTSEVGERQDKIPTTTK